MLTYRMPELRLNLITKEWVIIATERAKRPGDFRERREHRFVPERLDSCPFCPGNEGKTPPEITRIPSENGWKVRVTPNKFMAVSPEGERVRRNEGLKHFVTGVGRHEVIIESPLHNTSLALLSTEDVAEVIAMKKERFNAIYADPRVEHVIIFKNHGEASGTSIQHPHLQIIGTPITPLQVRDRISEATSYFDHIGECLMCATLKDEIRDGSRVVMDTRHFTAFVPYAALSPFHMWIIPKRHSACFGNINDEEIRDLSQVLKTVLLKLHVGLDNPDYNYVIRSDSPERGGSEYFHWYMSIVPRLVQTAGFQLGSGIYTNISIPEEIAEFLRNAKTD